MEHRYLLGIKSIAKFFGMSPSDIITMVERGGIPGVRKIKRKSIGNFPGGGRGLWILDRQLAEKFRHTRQKTVRYDPKRATEALLNKYAETGCRSIPELIDMGYIDDLDWCDALNVERGKSNLHVPILMHPEDLFEWFGTKRKAVTKKDLYPETTQIFKTIRRGRQNGIGE